MDTSLLLGCLPQLQLASGFPWSVVESFGSKARAIQFLQTVSLVLMRALRHAGAECIAPGHTAGERLRQASLPFPDVSLTIQSPLTLALRAGLYPAIDTGLHCS